MSKAQARAARAVKILQKYRQLLVSFGCRPGLAMRIARRWHVSEATLYRWRRKTRGAPEELWCAILRPRFVGRTKRAPFAPDAWEMLKDEYLRTGARPRRLKHCIDRLRLVAQARGWRLPSDRTITRLMTEELRRRGLRTATR